jgi:tetratricopeptide (TPR) repeat protein
MMDARDLRGAALAAILCAAAPAAGGAAEEPAPAAASDPARIRLLLHRADANLRLHGLTCAGKFQRRAVADLREAVAALPAGAAGVEAFDACFSLAFALVRGEAPADPEEARAGLLQVYRLLDRAAKLDGSSPGLWIVDGMAREAEGKTEPAVANITRGLNLLDERERTAGFDPGKARQLRFFGLLARGRAQLEERMNAEHLAEKDFAAAVALGDEALREPDAPREDNFVRRVALTHHAAGLQRLDRFPEAEALLATLVKEDPGNPAHYYNLALVNAQQQRFPASLEFYRKAASLGPSDPRPHVKIAYILVHYPEPGREPDLDGARRAADRYLGLRRGDPDAEYCTLRGEVAWRREDLAESERWFRRAVAADPGCRAALSRLAHILGRRDDGSEISRKAIEEIRRLLLEAEKGRRHGRGMEERKVDLTFC